MAFSVIQVEHQKAAASLLNTLNPQTASPRQSLRRLGDWFRGLAGGAYRGTTQLRVGAVKATATLTIAGDPTAADTFVVCGVTFTARDSGATGDEFNISTGDNTATAAAIAAAVNASASTDVTGAVVASSSLGVVTFTALVAGTAGNGYVLTESMDNTTRVDFAGGTNGTAYTLTAGGAS